jgi:hypothetical protein
MAENQQKDHDQKEEIYLADLMSQVRHINIKIHFEIHYGITYYQNDSVLHCLICTH